MPFFKIDCTAVCDALPISWCGSIFVMDGMRDFRNGRSKYLWTGPQTGA
jgi:hypothetical protein